MQGSGMTQFFFAFIFQLYPAIAHFLLIIQPDCITCVPFHPFVLLDALNFNQVLKDLLQRKWRWKWLNATFFWRFNLTFNMTIYSHLVHCYPVHYFISLRSDGSKNKTKKQKLHGLILESRVKFEKELLQKRENFPHREYFGKKSFLSVFHVLPTTES